MYMKYSHLRLEAKLFNGKIIHADIEFDDSCNVILTDSNTQGKSTIINSLIVGLGFDEIAKGNVTALVKDTINLEGDEHRMLSACIYLDIKNEKNEHLTVRREINPEFSKAVYVRRAPLSEWNDGSIEEYYLGKNSYNSTRGFHNALCEFIEFPDIKVISQEDGIMRLYLEYIFSAIFIEQKRGWGDIMTNSPFYAVREPKKSTISEILGMDYIKNNLRRNRVKFELDHIKLAYDVSFTSLKQHVNGLHFSLSGIYPDININTWNPRVFRSSEGQENISLSDLIHTKERNLASLESPPEKADQSTGLQERMTMLAASITKVTTQKDQLAREISTLNNTIDRYRKRRQTLEDDLFTNKEELKIREIFGRDKWSVKSHCPVCEQRIDETLLSQLKSFPTMSISENIKYIEDQKTMLDDIIKIEDEQAHNQKGEYEHLTSTLEELLSEHSGIQKSLTGAIPSEIMAYARKIAQIENELKSFKDLEELAESEFGKLKELHAAYHEKNTEFSQLKPDLSQNDSSLLTKFSNTFKRYTKDLGFSSFEAEALFIDRSNFMPRVMSGESYARKKARVDFGSSASDWVRIVTAYTLALHACRSNSEKSNHPNVSIFDEPNQQNMDLQDYLKFYGIISDVAKSGGQVIVAATDKHHAARKKAESLGLHIIDFKDHFVLSSSSTYSVN